MTADPNVMEVAEQLQQLAQDALRDAACLTRWASNLIVHGNHGRTRGTMRRYGLTAEQFASARVRNLAVSLERLLPEEEQKLLAASRRRDGEWQEDCHKRWIEEGREPKGPTRRQRRLRRRRKRSSEVGNVVFLD